MKIVEVTKDGFTTADGRYYQYQEPLEPNEIPSAATLQAIINHWESIFRRELMCRFDSFQDSNIIAQCNITD